MKTARLSSSLVALALALLTVLCHPPSAFSQGTAFTYQGRLNDGANAANGTYDLQFTVYDALTAGGVQGGPLTNATTSVSNGLFTVTLDFGVSPFTGAERWLEIGVRTNGSAGAYQTLAPRQQLTSTPYATRAANFNGPVASSQITGTIPLAQLPVTLVTNGASGVTFSGTFSGNGAGVTNLGLASINSLGVFVWLGDFGLASSPGVGQLPSSVAAADVNGDGKVDLICANADPHINSLSVLTNNGSGGFVLASTLVVGNRPVSVVAADVNGDGKVDLICAKFGNNTLSVLTNNGNGGFVLASSPAVGTQPVSVVAADVNADGKVDLICANSGNNTLSVLTNNGDGSGSFTLASSPTVGSNPSSVTAADVNGDGYVDLICANDTFNGTLSVLTNDGSGNFVLASSPAVGEFPTSVTAADVNRDGYVDLICANGTTVSGTLSVLLNNGDGSGNFTLGATPAVGNSPSSVTTADVNGDGKVDLICANETVPGTLSVLTNDGFGDFTLVSSPGVGSYPVSVVAADVNRDGHVDLICANRGGSTLSVLFGVPRLDANVNAGSVTAASFGGNGSGLTNLNAANLTGSLAGAQLPANVALLDANQTFSGANALTNPANIFVGNGAGLTGLNAGQVTSGTLSDALLSSNVALLGGNQTFSGTNALTNAANTIGGNGTGLTSLNASQLTSGTVSDARLSANVALLGANQTFSGVNALTNPANTFTGHGAGLTGLNAGQLTTGTVPNASLAGTYSNALTLTNAANTIAGNGAGLTSLNASQLSNGTVPDARLSGNVALLNASQTFIGQNIFSNSVVGGGVTLDASSASGAFNLKYTNGIRSSLALAAVAGNYSADAAVGDTVLRAAAGKLLLQAGSGASAIAIATNNLIGIGTNAPATALHVAATNDVEISVQSFDPGGRRWTVQSSGAGTPGLTGSFQIIDRSAGASRLLIDTNGNVGIGTSSPLTNKLQVMGGATFSSGASGANQTVVWTPGSASWSFTSDRNTKDRVAAVDPESILEKLTRVPIVEWSYIGYDQRHIGPMAQDFHLEFPLNPNDKALNDADLHGVALAAIQGLNEKVESGKQKAEILERRLEQKETEISELKEHLDQLKALVKKFIAEKDGGVR